jgi:hypothetical protein
MLAEGCSEILVYACQSIRRYVLETGVLILKFMEKEIRYYYYYHHYCYYY